MSLPPQPIFDAALSTEYPTLERTSDALAIETLVHLFYADVYRLSISILNDNHEAEDVTQETFIAAATGLDRFRGDSKIKTWLFGIAINVCRSRIRKLRSRQMLQSALESLHFLRPRQQTPEEAAERTETRNQLQKAIQALDEKHRLPVILHYIHDLTVPEIAATLGVKPGTVYSRLHYARKKLHALLMQANAPPYL